LRLLPKVGPLSALAFHPPTPVVEQMYMHSFNETLDHYRRLLRLYLPESWTKDGKRREEAGIPEEVVFKTKWQLSLDMIDQVRTWGLPNRIVVADAGYGDTTEFRDELEARQLSYVLGISSTTGVWSKPPQAKVPRYQGRGAPATRYAYRKQRPTSAQDAAVQARGWKRIRWRQGTKGWLESRFVASRVQPSHGFVRGQPPHKEVWLLSEWPESEKEPTKYSFAIYPSPIHCDD
jgi:SRSO17 transposase